MPFSNAIIQNQSGGLIVNISRKKPANLDPSQLNIRKSLMKAPDHMKNGNGAHDEQGEGGRTSQTRKTLMHNRDDEAIANEQIGVQNSSFSLDDVEYKLSRLAQIHLVLEHLLLIRSSLDMENRKNHNMSSHIMCMQHKYNLLILSVLSISLHNIPERSSEAIKAIQDS